MADIKIGISGNDGECGERGERGDRDCEKDLRLCRRAARFRASQRKLWEDHVWRTRNLIISRLATPILGDLIPVLNWLQQNQTDIGNSFKTFYGNAYGDQLANLLHAHVNIAVDVVNAAVIAGFVDENGPNYLLWRANATEIAQQYASVNKHLSFAKLNEMLQVHLDLTAAEVDARLIADWNADIASFDAGETHMLMFSDYVANGTVENFERKFKSEHHFHFNLGPKF
jgi:hypothetical protein